jgi:hypothetical protein
MFSKVSCTLTSTNAHTDNEIRQQRAAISALSISLPASQLPGTAAGKDETGCSGMWPRTIRHIIRSTKPSIKHNEFPHCIKPVRGMG